MENKLVLGARVILGGLFVVFGLNFFFPFMATPPSTPEGGQFLGALFSTGYMFPLIKITEIVAGVLILSGIAVPLGLILLSPIVVNIFAFHTILSPDPALPLVLVALMLFLGWSYRRNFKNLFISARL